jgi:hypothetical protein
MRATCQAHLTLPNYITLITTPEEYSFEKIYHLGT